MDKDAIESASYQLMKILEARVATLLQNVYKLSDEERASWSRAFAAVEGGTERERVEDLIQTLQPDGSPYLISRDEKDEARFYLTEILKSRIETFLKGHGSNWRRA